MQMHGDASTPPAHRTCNGRGVSYTEREAIDHALGPTVPKRPTSNVVLVCAQRPRGHHAFRQLQRRGPKRNYRTKPRPSLAPRGRALYTQATVPRVTVTSRTVLPNTRANLPTSCGVVVSPCVSKQSHRSKDQQASAGTVKHGG